MFTQRRYPFKRVLIWTKREIIFFVILATVITVLYVMLDVKWLQVPLTPVGLIGTSVAFIVGFQNNAAYDRIWEARKIWGGIVNTSRTLIITVKDSFYINRTSATKNESEALKIITNRHIAWLTTLCYALRTKKSWELSYKSTPRKSAVIYHVPEFQTPLEEELKPYLSKEEYEYTMSKDNKPNAVINLQSRHLSKLTDEKRYGIFLY